MNSEDRTLKTEDRSVRRVLASARPRTAYRLPPTAYCSRGFSFTEILFAIMILGIGFIMVAAMFPVAIQQTETSRQETVGAAVARGGVEYAQQLAETRFVPYVNVNPPPTENLSVLRPTLFFPTTSPPIRTDHDLWLVTQPGGGGSLTGHVPTAPAPATIVIPGQVWDLNLEGDPIDVLASVNGQPTTSHPQLGTWVWSAASQNMIQTADSRFAWVAFYKRDLIETITSTTTSFAFAPSAQVIVLALQSRNKQYYYPSDLVLSAASPASIQAFQGSAHIRPPDASHLGFTIQFNVATQQLRAAEGAFVIISNDTRDVAADPLHGQMNGHVYRLGIFDSTNSVWEFAPGYGLSTADAQLIPPNGADFVVYTVGRAREPNPDGTYPPSPVTYTGLGQDIAVYSTFIPCGSN